MCDPLSLTVVSAGIGAGGAIYSGIQGKSAHEANAAALEVQAKARETKSQFDIDQAQQRFTKTQGAAIAQIAKSGLTVGSFSDILSSNAGEASIEQEAIRYGANLDADGIRYRAASERTAGKSSEISGYINAAGAVVGAAGNYYKMSGYSTKKGATLSGGPFSREANSYGTDG